MGKFINPFTDYGFKKIFGQDFNKDFLIDFLNVLLEGERHIVDINYVDKELLPSVKSERGIIYDVFCTTDTGEHIIVEMQNRIHYSLVPVYGIYFMNWEFPEGNKGKLRTDVGLTDLSTGKLFTDRMRMIFIQIPLMTKEEEECETDFERWIYVLKNMETLTRMPFAAQKAIFDRLGSIAEIEAMDEPERSMYDESLRIYRDSLAVARGEWERGRQEGRQQGRQEGRQEGRVESALEIAKNMKLLGLDIPTICKATRLTQEQIEKL